MPPVACTGFKLLPVALEQMLLPVCDGSKPLPVAPKTDQELLSVALEQILLPVAPVMEQEQELLPTTSE